MWKHYILKDFLLKSKPLQKEDKKSLIKILGLFRDVYFAYLVRTPGAQTSAVDKQWSTWTPGTDHMASEAGDTLSQLVARPYHRHVLIIVVPEWKSEKVEQWKSWPGAIQAAEATGNIKTANAAGCTTGCWATIKWGLRKMKNTCSVHISLCNQQEKRKTFLMCIENVRGFCKEWLLGRKRRTGLH